MAVKHQVYFQWSSRALYYWPTRCELPYSRFRPLFLCSCVSVELCTSLSFAVYAGVSSLCSRGCCSVYVWTEGTCGRRCCSRCWCRRRQQRAR